MSEEKQQTYEEAMNEWLDLEEIIEVGQDHRLNREQRELLNSQSLEAFGVKSRWQTLMRKKRLSLEQVVKTMEVMINHKRRKDASDETRQEQTTATHDTTESSGGGSKGSDVRSTEVREE